MQPVGLAPVELMHDYREALTLRTFSALLSRLQRSAAPHLDVQEALEVFLFLSARCTQTPRQMTECTVRLSNNCEQPSDVVIRLPLNFNWCVVGDVEAGEGGVN